MYYFFFIIFIFSGLFFGIVVFLWALKSGQFKEQQRARYLPLEDEQEVPHNEVSRSSKLQSYVLFGILILGLYFDIGPCGPCVGYCLCAFIVVVKKTFRYSNVFFYNHLYPNSAIRNIIMKSGII
jgi:cbb3-type cytochrome oxidase maturation protein